MTGEVRSLFGRPLGPPPPAAPQGGSQISRPEAVGVYEALEQIRDEIGMIKDGLHAIDSRLESLEQAVEALGGDSDANPGGHACRHPMMRTVVTMDRPPNTFELCISCGYRTVGV